MEIRSNSDSLMHLLLLTNRCNSYMGSIRVASMDMYTPPLHIGLLDFNIIASDTILLIISISTTFALSMTIRVSNEAKFFQEVKFLGFMRCFSVKIEKSSKMSKIQPKMHKKRYIFKYFSILTEKQRMKP